MNKLAYLEGYLHKRAIDWGSMFKTVAGTAGGITNPFAGGIGRGAGLTDLMGVPVSLGKRLGSSLYNMAGNLTQAPQLPPDVKLPNMQTQPPAGVDTGGKMTYSTPEGSFAEFDINDYR